MNHERIIYSGIIDSAAEKCLEQKAKGEEKANRNNSGLKIVTTGGKQTTSQKLIATKMPLLVRRTFAPSSKKGARFAI